MEVWEVRVCREKKVEKTEGGKDGERSRRRIEKVGYDCRERWIGMITERKAKGFRVESWDL